MKPSILSRNSRAFTILELIVSMTLTTILILIIFYVYMNISAGLQKTQREISTLASIRNATQALEGHLRSMVVKSGYLPPPPRDFSAPVFKPLHQGQFRIRWPEDSHLSGYADGKYQDGRCRYLGFYSTTDGIHVDRFEYWFNPPESSGKQSNGKDDDGDDDPDDARNPLHLMRDDRGRLMMRRVPDALISMTQYHNTPPDGTDSVSSAPFPAYRAPHLTGLAGSEYDDGEILVEGLSDVYFEFIYSKRDEKNLQGPDSFQVANRWPFCNDDHNTQTDLSGALWPHKNDDGRVPRGLSFIALPLAIRVTFEVETGIETRRYQQTLTLPQSQWHEFLHKKN